MHAQGIYSFEIFFPTFTLLHYLCTSCLDDHSIASSNCHPPNPFLNSLSHSFYQSEYAICSSCCHCVLCSSILLWGHPGLFPCSTKLFWRAHFLEAHYLSVALQWKINHSLDHIKPDTNVLVVSLQEQWERPILLNPATINYTIEQGTVWSTTGTAQMLN